MLPLATVLGNPDEAFFAPAYAPGVLHNPTCAPWFRWSSLHLESEYHLQSKPGKEGEKLEWVKISFGMGTLKLETVVKVKVLLYM